MLLATGYSARGIVRRDASQREVATPHRIRSCCCAEIKSELSFLRSEIRNLRDAIPTFAHVPVGICSRQGALRINAALAEALSNEKDDEIVQTKSGTDQISSHDRFDISTPRQSAENVVDESSFSKEYAQPPRCAANTPLADEDIEDNIEPEENKDKETQQKDDSKAK